MTRLTKVVLFVALVFACRFTHAQTVPKYPAAPIAGSVVRAVHSPETGRNYDLYIRVPKDSSGTTKYPVLFVLDGQWDFKLLDSVHGGLLYDKFIPEMVIVGITYSSDNPSYDSLRARDYTATHTDRLPGSGDAAKFLSFLKLRVFPLVQNEYAADPARRVLLGNSLGGLFTLWAMLTEPDLFTGYIASSPAVSYDNDALFKLEARFAASHKPLAGRLFIGAGAKEDLAPAVKRFIEVLGTHSYSGLSFQTAIFPGEGHTSNKPLTYNQGLRFVMSGKSER